MSSGSIFGKARDGNKRAQHKINSFIFILETKVQATEVERSSDSIFGKARDGNKREQYKINEFIFAVFGKRIIVSQKKQKQ